MKNLLENVTAMLLEKHGLGMMPAIILVGFVLLGLGIGFWAFRPKSKSAYDKMARIALDS